MTESGPVPPQKSAPAARPRRWGRRLGIIAGVLLLFIVVLYFVGTSAAFFKGVILPRVSKSLGAEVTAADASIHPFSRIVLKQFKVQPPGFEPLVEAQSLVARYSLMAIMHGNIHVEEVTLTDPVIRLVQKADGSSSLDVFTKNKKSPSESSRKSEKPARIDIHNVALKNGTILKIDQHPDGSEERTRVTEINLTLDQLKNGGSGTFEIASNIRMEQTNKSAAAPSGALTGKVGGKFNFSLTDTLLPRSIQGNSRLDVLSADGALADLNGLAGIVEADWTPAEIRNLSLRFEQKGKALGRARLFGPFDAMKKEGRIQLEVSAIDRQVLNLAGAGRGLDFGGTRVSGAGTFQVSKQGAAFEADGKFSADRFSVKRQDQTTPTLDVVLQYKVAVNLDDKSALVSALDLHGRQNDRELIEGKLDRPMTVRWGGSQAALPESAFRLNLNDLRLEDWRAMLGPGYAGVLRAQSVVAARSNAEIQFDTTATLQNLTADVGGARLDRGQIELASSAKYTPGPKQNRIGGTVEIKNLSGDYGTYQVRNYQARAEFALENEPEKVEIRQMRLNLGQNGQPGGSVDLSGTLRTGGRGGSLTAKIAGVNQNGIGLFLAPTLKGKELVSIAVNGSLNAQFEKDAAIKGDLKVSDFVVRDPAKNAPDAPLSVDLKVDAARKNGVMEIALAQIGLSPTERGKNQIDIKGRLDFTRPNQGSGNLTVAAESLDLTPFYDLYAPPGAAQSSGAKVDKSTRKKPAASPAPSRAGAVVANPEEPAAVKLPVQQFAFDLNLGAVYLRELVIKNVRAPVKVNGGLVAAGPVQCSVNGAPLKASVELDLGRAGYGYNVSFDANDVPLEPVANTFIPEKKGQYKGSILASAQIKGAGTTGANLRKNLAGRITFTFTNANIQIVGQKWMNVLVPIATLLRVKDITETPLNWVRAEAEMGNGNINFKQFTAVSEAFQADTSGVIPIADVFTNSPLQKLPVNFQLRRSLAQKSNLMPSDAPPDSKYVKLPDFVKLTGTIGDPRSDINELALAGVLLRSGSGLVPGKTGSVLQEIGGVLTGKPVLSSGTNGTAGTNNAAATNKPNQKINATDLLRGILKK